jgi:hypothetical protein
VLFKRGTSSAAVGYLKEAVANSPADAPGLNVMRHHLAQAYVANNQQDKAIEVLEEMLSALELQMTEASQQGGNPREPAWAVEARSMLENLKSGT